MEILTLILQILVLFAIGCIFLFRKYLFSYSSEKGKNLATKEDISEITGKIEAVKLDHARQLEAARAELSSQINTHGFRYEKEYDVLSELSALLVDVRDASLSLRPAMDFIDPNKSKEEIKRERLGRFYEALRALYLVREKKRPFYPKNIYEAIRTIEKESRSESIQYQYKDPMDNKNYIEYWEQAEKNQETITKLAETAMSNIRDRVTKWESLSDGL
ncbi:hypothetical protein [Cellvibrio sp. QJXJ]|uniref:hypothetical protein n=1 Tax=Cellvibrio sp. QJXJ TaxID=2964606 RepID=UPI0021C2A944|nr:hypothetical protein [Cellvibrio sp. QJXJ]UUA72102.1 hypothetical protein NNX04_16985 [Cellvibrio sp. QJXJ]